MRRIHCDRADCYAHYSEDAPGLYTIVTSGPAADGPREWHACNAHCAMAVIAEHEGIAGTLTFATPKGAENV